MFIGEIYETLNLFIKQLEKCNIDYYIGGSIASSSYGLPRATFDIDLVANIRENNVLGLVETLENDYYIDEIQIKNAIKNQSSFNIINLKTMMKIDIFLLKNREYDQLSFKRRKMHKKFNFYMESPEDVIIHKLEWYVMGNKMSERQKQDIIGILKVQSDELDYKYLEKWTKELSLYKLFMNLKNEIIE